MKLTAEPFDLRFIRPFVISHGARLITATVLISLEHEGVTGFGEAALPPYYPETQQSVLQFLQKNESLIPQFMNDPALLHSWMKEDGEDRSAKAGLEMAVLDWFTRKNSISLASFLCSEGPTPPCSLTIAAGKIPDLQETIRDHPEFGLYKIKLTGSDDLDRLHNVRSLTTASLAVDVNGGWMNLAEAVEKSKRFADLGVLYLEQPFPRDAYVLYERFRELSALPVIADESIRTPDEFSRYHSLFHGVNIKLMKSPGLFRSLELIRSARAEGLKVMIGCMSESSCGVGAAAALQGKADWVDLDGPLLIGNDPFTGLSYNNGKLIVEGRCGTGIRRKAD